MKTQLLRCWQALPCKTMLFLIVVCLGLGEFYPFSNFPMFGSFGGKTYYVYLADQDGKALPAMQFGVPTNGIKKAYDAALQKAKKTLPKKGKISPEQDRLAAEETLRYLLARRSRFPAPDRLRLVRVDLRLDHGEITKVTRVAGEIAAR